MQIPKKIIDFRTYVQCFVFLMVIMLPVFYFYGYTSIRGNFYAWNFFGIPFADPLNAVQGIIQGILNGFWPLSSIILGALLSLGLAFFCGRIFCSWLCPYGFLSEFVWKIGGKKNISKSKTSAWKWRIILTICLLVIGTFLGIPLLNHISNPGLISLAPLEFWRVVLPNMGLLHSGAEGAIILPPAIIPSESPFPALFMMLLTMLSPVVIILFAEYLFKKRVWCAYICPQALLLMLAARLGHNKYIPALKVNWQAELCNCKGENPCTSSCTLGLNPRTLHKKALERDACINCGDCVKTCFNVNLEQKRIALSLETKR